MTIFKNLCVNLLLYHDLPNPTVCNLKSVVVLTNALGRNLISVLGFTNPLGRRLISALVLTSHLKCQAVLLILLCLVTPFFNSPRLFLVSSTYYPKTDKWMSVLWLVIRYITLQNSLMHGFTG